MIVWAREYRFYKNYNRSVQNQWYFLNTYMSANLTLSRALVTRYSKGNVAAVGSGVSLKLVRYFSRQSRSTRLYWLPVYRNSA